MNVTVRPFLLISFLANFSCSTTAPSSVSAVSLPAEQERFFQNLKSLCGKSFEGQVTRSGQADEDWIKAKKIMNVRDCSENEIKIPLHVGENRSRTWIVTRTGQGLQLKHDHRHEDGSPETVTMYGGIARDKGSAVKQAFPVDAETRTLFLKNRLEVAVDNVWILEMEPNQSFSYSLTRENRDFRIDFDLRRPVSAPVSRYK